MDILKYVILLIGWPVLVGLSLIIFSKTKSFHDKLKGNILGKLIIPAVFGWLLGMYALAFVATSYMLEIDWVYSVVPAFLIFLYAINSFSASISDWEKEATDLKQFYEDLEVLVKKRTAELEDAHNKQIAHEKEIQKLKDQFVFIAAHELRTPVTAIGWSLELALEQGKDKLDPEVLESLRSVENSNNRLIRLVDDLLNVARIESGTIKVEPAEFKIKAVIEETIKEMQTVFKEQKSKVEFKMSKDVSVFADQARVKQILINLLSNATKYKKDKVNIKVSTKKKDDKLIISVEDNGLGIKPEDIKILFTKFGRIRNKETNDIEGTGLGLFLCKEILEQMDGDIWVESKEGEGSIFSFSMPLGGKR